MNNSHPSQPYIDHADIHNNSNPPPWDTQPIPDEGHNTFPSQAPQRLPTPVYPPPTLSQELQPPVYPPLQNTFNESQEPQLPVYPPFPNASRHVQEPQPPVYPPFQHVYSPPDLAPFLNATPTGPHYPIPQVTHLQHISNTDPIHMPQPLVYETQHIPNQLNHIQQQYGPDDMNYPGAQQSLHRNVNTTSRAWVPVTLDSNNSSLQGSILSLQQKPSMGSVPVISLLDDAEEEFDDILVPLFAKSPTTLDVLTVLDTEFYNPPASTSEQPIFGPPPTDSRHELRVSDQNLPHQPKLSEWPNTQIPAIFKHPHSVRTESILSINDTANKHSQNAQIPAIHYGTQTAETKQPADLARQRKASVSSIAHAPEQPQTRMRSASVVSSRISAYNMKFRSDLAAPSSRPRSLTTAANSNYARPPNVLASEAKLAAESALLNNIERHQLSMVVSPQQKTTTDPHVHSIIKTSVEPKQSTITKKKETHYKSAQSLRSIKSRRASLKSSVGESIPSIRELPLIDLKRSKRIQIQKSNVKVTWVGGKLARVHRKLKSITTGRRDGLVSLFSGTLKLIEGRFGTGVGSYFRISRTIFIMNLVLGTLWFSVVLVQAVLSLGGAYYVGNVRVNMSWASVIQSMLNRDDWFDNVQKFFSGDGWLEYTPGFYAALPPLVLNGTYRMDLAYIFSILASIVISFVLILRRMRSEYVRSATMNDQDDVYPFAVICFSTWGHTIQRHETLQNQIFAISTLIKIAISQSEVKARKTAAMLSKSMYKVVVVRVATNFFCTSILLVAGLFIYDSVTLCTGLVNTFFYNVVDLFSQNLSPNVVRCVSPSQPTPFPPYVVSISNAVLPSVFDLISKFEMYSDPQWETRATLARSYMIKICSVYLMLFSMYPQVSDSKVSCWEHEVAKRFYSLLWLDLGLTCVSTVVSAILTKKIYGEYEFDITSNILELVYRQAIIWIGSIYAPIMSFISVLSTTIIFYVKRYTVTTIAQPPRRIFNTYTQVIWFLMFMLLTLVLIAAPILFAVVILKPSTSCGPYRETPVNSIRFDANQGSFSVIAKSIDQIPDQPGKHALVMIGSIAVIGPVLAALLIWVYFLLAVSHKRNMRVIELENEIKEERNDKKALIRFYGVKT